MSDLAAWARTIGQTIRRLRLSQGLTQQDLAGDAFSKSYISQLERGSVIPSLRALDILAERLGVPTTFFIEGTGKGAGFLLKIATISYFIGDVEQA
ncbi:MAG TPA: helix-turn-helix transcriptional regulator, partial [Limnochordia bacterium]|nr:helix-turn-helix transcriptional regulator [Limnochordia bacterium]